MGQALKKAVVTPIARGAQISARRVGERVGANDKQVEDDLLSLHKRYHAASEDAQKTMRREYMVGYILKKFPDLCNSDADVADAIVVPKDYEDFKRTKAQEDAWQAASQSFKYRVDRTGSKAKLPQRGKVAKGRPQGANKYNVNVSKRHLTPQVRKLADQLFAQFPRAKDLDEQFRMVKAALDLIVREAKEAAKGE